jgi:choline-glycine betaine transporter
MGFHGVSAVERALKKVLAPLCVASGVVVVSGFFFPDALAAIVSGQGWLVVSLLFFGSVLAYLAVLPGRGDGTDDTLSGAAYFLQIRRLGPVDTVRDFLSRHDPVTFGVPVAGLVAFFVLQTLLPERTIAAVGAVEGVVTGQLGPLFVGVIVLSVLFCLYLLFGSLGDVRLGGPDAEPAYSYSVYFTMFFSAGIAAGIVFWGPAAGLFHYGTVPPFFDVPAQSDAAITAALTTTLFHWGFSAWSAYIVVGVPIAYFVYQHGAPLRVSSLLTPFLGVDGLDSNWCRLVDLLAVFATVGGIATSVSLVGQQFLTGINYQWGVPFDSTGALLFAAGLTLVFVISAQSGVHRGIRRNSVVNVLLFAFVGILLLALVPRSFVIEEGSRAVGSYVVNFVPMSLTLGGEWIAAWTVFNWSWWFSWAPFAGLFLAALSRGRRIRTVVFTGFVATSLATMVWFLLMGVTSLYVQYRGIADVLGAISAAGGSEAVAGYPVLDALPLSELLIFLFLALIITFIVTSADTSTLVISILASRRTLAPTTGTIVVMGVFQGLVAVGVLVTNSSAVLQTAAVLTGGPFAIVALVAIAGLVVGYRRDGREDKALHDRAQETLDERGVTLVPERPDLREGKEP